MRSTLRITVVAVLLLLAGSVHGYEDKTIAQWLSDNGFVTLVSVLKTANLYSVLDSPGVQYTLFAPTDKAFQAVPSSTLNKITGNAALLEAVLKYHVLSGFILAPLLSDGETRQTLQGDDVLIAKTSTDVSVNGARLIQPDVILNNGVIHVIDQVLLPPAIANDVALGELLLRNETIFSTLNLLLTITDLEPVLFSGNLTLFAPTNDAFAAIISSLPDLSAPGAKDIYTETLKNHLANGLYKAADLTDGQRLTMLSGHTVTIRTNPSVKVNNANVIAADIMASNGVMHIIDAVLVY